MYHENPIDPRLSNGGYVPYFYDNGHFLTYSPAQQDSPDHSEYKSLSSSGIASTTPATHLPAASQTVEQIIASGYLAIPGGDSVTALLTDKRSTSWLGLDDTIRQIRKRYELYAQNLYQITLAQCAATNSLYAHWAYHGLPSSKQFYSRHKQVQELYQEQREERQSLWRDVSRLRQALPESAQLYLSTHRKLEALADTPGDAL